jgi:UDP:flavonoid glycosyltransferase YjiC (YdhE family)
MFRVLEDMCVESDFLLSISSFPLAHIVYETTNIPFICVDLESVHGGPHSFTAPLERQIAALVNPFRQQLGLPAVAYPLSLDAYSPDLTLFATSRQCMSPARNWPANAHITGFLFLDEDNWTPDQALLDFLAAGELPILISFGSTAHADTQALASLMFAMIEQVGCRAIIQQSWTDLAGEQRLPATIHAVGFVSHAWLFPRMACLVCHGGTQTTASALRHGVPLLCVPHTWEHLPSALLVRSFQTGLVVPYEQLSVEKIAQAVREIITQPAYRQAVHALSQKIQAEDGLGKAVSLIGEFLSTIDA